MKIGESFVSLGLSTFHLFSSPIYKERVGGTLDAMVIVVGNGHMTVYISYSANTFEKGMNLAIFEEER